MVSSVANGVASAATYTVGAVPVLVTGTAAVAGAAGNAVAGAVSQSGNVLQYAGSAAKGVGGAAAGVVATSAVGTLALKAVGFTAIGPAAGSYAAAWMSSTAIANGGAVAAGSLYSVVQATAMGGGVLLGAPALLTTGAVAGAAVVWKAWF